MRLVYSSLLFINHCITNHSSSSSTIEDSQDTDSSLTPSPHKIHSISDFLDRNISTKGSGAPPPESPYMVPNTYPPAGSYRGLKKPTQSRLPQSQEVTELKSSLARIKKLNHRYINVANENLELKVDIELYRKELRQCKEELDAMQKKAENAIARSLFYQKLYFKSEASHNPGMPECRLYSPMISTFYTNTNLDRFLLIGQPIRVYS